MDGAQSAENAVTSPRVSVIMPVYNAMPYLREAIESILNQTFRDFEFIIVNDCSTDESWDVIQEYAARDARIVALSNEKNMRQAWSRNRALSVARGEYIAMQDADDISLSRRLELEVQYLDANPDIGAVGASACIIDSQGGFLSQGIIIPEVSVIEVRMTQACYLIQMTMMIRREHLRQIGGFSTEVPCSDDYDAWVRLMEVTHLGGIAEILGLYRVHASQDRISVKKREDQIATNREISLRAVKHLMQGRSLDEAAYRRFWRAAIGWPRFDLDIEDFRWLRPLWDFLATEPAYRQVWGLRLLRAAYYTARRRQLKTGLHLAYTGFFRLKMYTPKSIARLIQHVRVASRSRQQPRGIPFPAGQEQLLSSKAPGQQLSTGSR